LGARLGALFIDWLIAVVIVSPFTGHRPFTPGSNSPWVLAVFAAENIILVSLIGRTIGMRLCGIGIMRLDGRRVSFPWVVVRTALLVLVVPAVIYDRDRRGLGILSLEQPRRCPGASACAADAASRARPRSRVPQTRRTPLARDRLEFGGRDASGHPMRQVVHEP
jgi:hypothetical protein